MKAFRFRTNLLRRALTATLALWLSLGMIGALAEDIGTVNTKVVLRKEADKESKALQTLPEGEEVTLLALSGKWYKVSYGKYTGYVMKKYLDVSSSSTVANASAIANLGDAPGPCKAGDGGDDVKKLQSALNILGYYKGRIDGDYGDGTIEAVTNFQLAQKLEADGIAGKATIKAIFGSVGKASTTSSSKKVAATASPAASKAGDAMSGISSIEDIGSAPATSKEGDSGTKVKKLQQALQLLGYYNGEIDGSYGDGTVKAVKRFQKNRGMKQDGIAGSSTISVLFNTGKSSAGKSSTTTSSKTYKTEVLDWFADSVTKVIPKGARFTIMDVKTGTKFEAVRWSGVNHLDAEPRTSEDTATMKSIYGGSWSWRRRAILILYDGHVYAASMNGMPHGTTTISNDFDGHFCIHFKNSKTHGTKTVDDDHQTCGTQASKATWK